MLMVPRGSGYGSGLPCCSSPELYVLCRLGSRRSRVSMASMVSAYGRTMYATACASNAASAPSTARIVPCAV